MFGTKQSKIDCKRPSNTKQMNRLQNIRIEFGNTKLLRNTKHNQEMLVLAVFVSAYCTNIALNYIKQTRYN